MHKTVLHFLPDLAHANCIRAAVLNQLSAKRAGFLFTSGMVRRFFLTPPYYCGKIPMLCTCFLKVDIPAYQFIPSRNYLKTDRTNTLGIVKSGLKLVHDVSILSI